MLKPLWISITDANDLPEFGGDMARSITEDTNVDDDGKLVATGQLSITDQDVGEAVFIAQLNASTNGTFSILADVGRGPIPSTTAMTLCKG